MNQLLVQRFLSKTISSINDLNSHDFQSFRQNFFNKNKKLIKQKNFLEYGGLSTGNELYFWYYQIRECYKENILFTHTRVRLGKREIMIPIEVDVIMELIFSKDLNKRGLFRRSAAITKVRKYEGLLFEEISKNKPREVIIESLKDADIITLTIIFKKLFDRYELVFPIYFLNEIIEISKIQDHEKKIIKARLIILSLPPSNRYLLDCICRFFNLIHFINTDKGTDYSENMNMNGFAVVMAPKLFIRTNTDISMSMLNDAISFLEFLFLNCNEVFLAKF